MSQAQTLQISHRVWNEYNPNDKIEQCVGKGKGNYKYVVHHKDEKKSNNHISNLQKMTRERHLNIHKKGSTFSLSLETKEKMRKAKIGTKLSKETRRKVSESRKGIKFSKETKKKISEALKGKKASEETKKRMFLAQKGKKLSKTHKANISKARRDLYGK